MLVVVVERLGEGACLRSFGKGFIGRLDFGVWIGLDLVLHLSLSSAC